MLIPLGALSILFSILMAIHVVRNHNELYWIFIILIFQPFGGIIYFLAMVLPSLAGGSTSRRLQAAAKETLDPTRAYRTAKQAYDDSPTPAVVAKMAEAAAGLGHHQEAERLYAEAAQGIYAEDPTFLIGRAESLVELSRNDEALDVLNALGELGEKGRTPRAALLMGRAYEALSRYVEADDAYSWAAERYTGLEGSARYAAFLQHTGRTAEAQDILTELNKRYAKTQAHFRKDAKTWRDFAAAAVGEQR